MEADHHWERRHHMPNTHLLHNPFHTTEPSWAEPNQAGLCRPGYVFTIVAETEQCEKKTSQYGSCQHKSVKMVRDLLVVCCYPISGLSYVHLSQFSTPTCTSRWGTKASKAASGKTDRILNTHTHKQTNMHTETCNTVHICAHFLLLPHKLAPPHSHVCTHTHTPLELKLSHRHN